MSFAIEQGAHFEGRSRRARNAEDLIAVEDGRARHVRKISTNVAIDQREPRRQPCLLLIDWRAPQLGRVGGQSRGLGPRSLGQAGTEVTSPGFKGPTCLR